MMARENRTVMPLWTATEAAEATKGKATGDWNALGVSIDSRTLVPGDLFIAIAGPAHDGHDHVVDAITKGAAAAVVQTDIADLSSGTPLLRVADTEQAMRDLGHASRRRVHAKICAITGSVGKTGTKEMVAAALAPNGSVAATMGNLNNHYGLPLSLARMPSDTDFGVFEMGMNHAGEIAPLSEMAAPHVAIITTVEPVHIEYFENVEGIADAKSEIFDGMPLDGVAVLNRDNPHFERLCSRAAGRGLSDMRSFGTHADATARLIMAENDATGTTVQATVAGLPVEYRLRLRGRHWAMNSLAVLLAADAMGVRVDTAAAALESVLPPKGRGQTIPVVMAQGSFTIVDETYNASPVAVKAALDVLSATAIGSNSRRVVVLGDMLELGDDAVSEHRGIAEHVKSLDTDLVFACGQHMSAIMNELPEAIRGGCADTSADLAGLVADAVKPGDLILIKGSAGSLMGRVVDALRALAVNANDNGGN